MYTFFKSKRADKTFFTNSSFYNLNIENELKCYLRKLFTDRLMNTAGLGAVYSACGMTE